MKIKIIRVGNNSEDELVEIVNNYIVDKNVIDIKYTIDFDLGYSVMVMYEDK